MRFLTYIGGAAVAAVVAMAATPSYAVSANGSFGVGLIGQVALACPGGTGDIAEGCTTKTLPFSAVAPISPFVNAIEDPYLGIANNLGLTIGDAVTLNSYVLPIVTGAATNIVLDTPTIQFTFTDTTRNSLIADTSFSITYTGTVTGGTGFDVGTQPPSLRFVLRQVLARRLSAPNRCRYRRRRPMFRSRLRWRCSAPRWPELAGLACSVVVATRRSVGKSYRRSPTGGLCKTEPSSAGWSLDSADRVAGPLPY